jgi:hypothetical protein
MLGVAVADSPEDGKAHRVVLIAAGIAAAGAIGAAVISSAWPDGTVSEQPAAAAETSETNPATEVPVVPTSEAPPTPTEPVVTVRHKGELSLRGDGADLDAPQSDPQWGRLNESNGRFADVESQEYVTPGWTIKPIGDTTITNLDGAPSYEACAAAQGYAESFLSYEGRVGQSWCVVTRDGRFAAMTLTNDDADNPLFDVTVWDAMQ